MTELIFLPFIKVSVFSYIAFFAFCLCYDIRTAAAVFLSVAIHETGHIIFILIFGDRINEIKVDPFGLTIKRYGKVRSCVHNVIIYLAGPLFSFILSAVCFLSGDTYTAQISLFYGIINLLPIRVFDGGKALTAILQKYIPMKSDQIINRISGTLIFLLWEAAVFIMLKSGNFVSSFFVCIYLFLALFL